MVRFEPNLTFSLKDALEGAKGEFTCPNCGKEFQQKVQRLEDGSLGIICPHCSLTIKLKS